MHAVLLAAVLAAPPTTTTTDLDEATEAVRSVATTGTLLFSKGDCLAVKVYTSSPFTHVAAVVRDGNETYVYDACNGDGVRRQTLAEYVANARPDRMEVVRPHRKFSPRRTKTFQDRLDEEIGRPYGVMHHLTGERAEGIHCSEYVTDALVECRLLSAESPPRVSPASLRQGVTGSAMYAHVLTLEVAPPPVPRETGRNWGHQLWIDTKVCTANFGRKMSRVFLCR